VTSGKDNRRQFERFPMSDHAIAVDQQGKTLGRVALAGGGGMTIHVESLAVAERLKPGHEIRVTIVEPDNKVSNTLDVVIKYSKGHEVGVQFVSGNETGKFPPLQ
jgi:hypothetical protein